jgi:predicted AlkP superfamily phosphohydrolase/phosphomutase
MRRAIDTTAPTAAVQTSIHRVHAILLACALALAAAALAPAAAAAESAEAAAGNGAEPKVVILGFDGVDAELTARWMDEGELPNLAKLRETGTFVPLRSTVPSQTPVSWSTFATGLNPGRHGIFDFLKRDTANYRPSFAAFDEGRAPFLWGEKNPLIVGVLAFAALFVLAFLVLLPFLRRRLGRAAIVAAVLGILAGAGAAWVAAEYLPVDRPIAINRQQGATFWEVLGEAGKRVRVIRVPVTFPPEPFPHGELLSGLGTPDLSGRIGKPFYFTSELFFQPKGGGDFSIEIVELVDNQGTIETEIKGPPNELFPDVGGYITLPMTLTVAEDKASLAIDVSGRHLELADGEWSDWVQFTFPFNPLIKVGGIGRFRVLSLEPEVRLYLSPIQFDPMNLPPVLDITAPAGFVDELADRFGRFKTIGWAIDTWSISDGTIDEAVFMEDVEKTEAKYREMLDGLLADPDWDVLVHYFEFTDRVQHVMYRHFDPEHPLYTEEGAAQWGDAILDSYRMMDEIVGGVVAGLPEGTVLLVVSDHGFAPWRRTMNYNNWLAQEGYLVLEGEGPARANLEDLFDQGEFFVNVDWSRTRAYAMGLGNVYINLAGREAEGIVQPGEEYRALVAELKAKLEAFVDSENGEHPVAHVFTRDEAYGTYDPALIPDLFPSNSRGYRVGWQDSLGIVAKQTIEPNTDVWSGDHCSVYPPLVNGILFSNVRLDAPDPYMADVMPTLLEIYGVEPPVQLDGESLWPG